MKVDERHDSDYDPKLLAKWLKYLIERCSYSHEGESCEDCDFVKECDHGEKLLSHANIKGVAFQFDWIDD